MTPEVVVGAVSFALLAVVLRPLLLPPAAEHAEDAAQESEARRIEALKALVEMEEDHEMGKLTAHDLEFLRARYERDALRALRSPDVAGAAEDPLESEVAAAKEKLRCARCGAAKDPDGACLRCAGS